MPQKMSLDEYLAQRGLASPIDDFMIDKTKLPHGETARQKEKRIKEAEAASKSYHEKRNAAIAEYKQKVQEGILVPKNTIERSLDAARGMDELESTQAARRMLEKRGIDWKTGKPKEGIMEPKKEFTDEELEACKGTDLVSLANYLGYKTLRVGSYYTIDGMDSIRIKHRHVYWRNSDGTDGSTIDFLMNLEGMTFREAVLFLLDFNGISHESKAVSSDSITKHYSYRWYTISVSEDGNVIADLAGKKKLSGNMDSSDPSGPELEEDDPESEKNAFVLPNANRNYDRLYDYLCKKRFISEDVLKFFIDQRLIFESVHTHNCVFVGRDNDGIIRHASLRGTYEPKNGKPFKGVLTGSDPRYSFHWTNKESDKLVVCEAPIDCISYFDFYHYLTFLQEGHTQVVPSLLALTGTHDLALEQYLKDNPNIKRIIWALDLDKAGNKAIIKLQNKYQYGLDKNDKDEYVVKRDDWQVWVDRKFQFKDDRVDDSFGVVKDYNEFLINSRLSWLEYDINQALEKNGEIPAELLQKMEEYNCTYDDSLRKLKNEKQVGFLKHLEKTLS